MRYVAVAIGAMLAGLSPAHAGEIKLDSAIEHVVVYPEGASITRRAAFTVPAGTSVLLLDNLPAELATDSLRVEGQSSAAVTIGSVEIACGRRRCDGGPETPGAHGRN